MRVSPSRLWARVADRLGTDPESAQLEVLGAAGYSWCAPATDPSFPFHRGVPDFFARFLGETMSVPLLKAAFKPFFESSMIVGMGPPW